MGTEWTLAAPASGVPTGTALNAGWRNFAVGMTGTLLRRSATEWTVLPDELPGKNHLYGVAGFGDEIFVVGSAGTIWRYLDR